MKAMLVLVAMVTVGGCADRPIDAGAASLPPPAYLCVWHFTSPEDTSDSDETPSVSNCDMEHLTIVDGIVSLEIQFDGQIRSPMCQLMTAISAGDDSTSWFYEVKGCDIVGLVGVNRR